MNKLSYVYILTNSRKTVIYIGVTGDLERRIFEHRKALVPGFTKRYNLKHLIHVEVFDDILEAVQREKSLKGKTRKKKEEIITTKNPRWLDLSKNW